MDLHPDGFPRGYPYDTWYGRNIPTLSGGGMPPDPTCMECDTELVDIDIDDEGRSCGRCPKCDPTDEELWTCPVCKGTRSIQPDRNSPPEPCPRCVDEDAGS